MIIEKVIGNIDDFTEQQLGTYHIERIYIENESLAKRMHLVETDHGREVRVRLAQGEHLHVGDILVQEDGNLVVVDVLSEDVLTIMPRSIHEMGEIAHALGNRHLPAQFVDETMIVQFDYLVENLLKEAGVPFKRENRYLKEAFRHIGHSHDE
ncbi:urease accessory protein UreE [Listeria booriae]|uniref:Urease accessory protein UreE n=1 Tax=Listeria booriae TaxID=1552123 RepID=A0A841YNH0_9LIST|nr:urease accessory protein UreE [Listeria booriae]MBC1402252.1 urease accessory protein UreE [Listeria booriae]MBC1617349.1 urease accessory protein UreE [Listeria booriae]